MRRSHREGKLVVGHPRAHDPDVRSFFPRGRHLHRRSALRDDVHGVHRSLETRSLKPRRGRRLHAPRVHLEAGSAVLVVHELDRAEEGGHDERQRPDADADVLPEAARAIRGSARLVQQRRGRVRRPGSRGVRGGGAVRLLGSHDGGFRGSTRPRRSSDARALLSGRSLRASRVSSVTREIRDRARGVGREDSRQALCP